MPGAGLRSFCAADGAEALRRMASHPKPSLIILDLLLPELDGWGFCEAIRANPATAHTPVIICSGAPAAVQESDSLAMNVQEFHPKPVDADVLLAAVRRLCA